MNESFGELLEIITEDHEFRGLTLEEKEQTFRDAADSFMKDRGLIGQDDFNDIAETLANKNQQVRQSVRAGRASITKDDAFAKIFSKLNNEFAFDIDDKGQISNVDDNKAKIEASRGSIRSIINQHPELIPNANDYEFLANSFLDDRVRHIDGKNKNRPVSAITNLLQGAVARVNTTFGFSDKGAREFFKENPKYDEEFFAGKLATGIGDVGATMSMVAGAGAAIALTGGTAAGAAAAAAATSIYSNAATRYKEAYDAEFTFSGDQKRADQAGIANLPAAAIDSMGDYLFAKALVPKGFGRMTHPEKLAYIANNVSKKDVFKAVVGDFVAQGSSELIGDYSAGQFQYNDTGNPKTIATRQQLIDSFLVGGAIGATASAGGQIKQSNEIRKFKLNETKTEKILTELERAANAAKQKQEAVNAKPKTVAPASKATDKAASEAAVAPIEEVDPEIRKRVADIELRIRDLHEAREDRAGDIQQENEIDGKISQLQDEKRSLLNIGPVSQDAIDSAAIDAVNEERSILNELEADGTHTPDEINKFRAELDRREAAAKEAQPVKKPLQEPDADAKLSAISVSSTVRSERGTRAESSAFSTEEGAAKWIAEELAQNPEAEIEISPLAQAGVNAAAAAEAVARLKAGLSSNQTAKLNIKSAELVADAPATNVATPEADPITEKINAEVDAEIEENFINDVTVGQPTDKENALSSLIAKYEGKLDTANETDRTAIEADLNELHYQLDELRLTPREHIAKVLFENNKRAAKKLKDRMQAERAAELNIEFKTKLMEETGIEVDDNGNIINQAPIATDAEIVAGNRNAFARLSDKNKAAKLEESADAIADQIAKLEAENRTAEQAALIAELGFTPSLTAKERAEKQAALIEKMVSQPDNLTPAEAKILHLSENSKRAAAKVKENIEKDAAAEAVAAKKQAFEEKFKAKLLAEQGINTDEALAAMDRAQKGFSVYLPRRLNESGFADLGAVAEAVSSAFKNGATSLATFTKELIIKLGEGIRQFAAELYQSAKQYVGEVAERAVRRAGGIAYAVDPNEENLGYRVAQGNDMKRAIDALFASNFYEGSYPTTASREGVQNAIDALNTSTEYEFKFIATGTRSLSLRENFYGTYTYDNGSGMSPERVLTKFLPAFVTGKEDVRAGGQFGLAKILLLGDADLFALRTRYRNSAGKLIQTAINSGGKVWKEFTKATFKIYDDFVNDVPGIYNFAGIDIEVSELPDDYFKNHLLYGWDREFDTNSNLSEDSALRIRNGSFAPWFDGRLVVKTPGRMDVGIISYELSKTIDVNKYGEFTLRGADQIVDLIKNNQVDDLADRFFPLTLPDDSGIRGASTGTVLISGWTVDPESQKKDTGYGDTPQLIGNPNEFIYSTNEAEPEGLYSGYDQGEYSLLHNLIEGIDHDFHRVALQRKGIKYGGNPPYDVFPNSISDAGNYNKSTIVVDGADITIYVDRFKTQTAYSSFRYEVSNNNAVQFEADVKLEGVDQQVKLPHVIINIDPTTNAANQNYPFTKSRDKIAPKSATAAHVKKFLSSIANAEQQARVQELQDAKKMNAIVLPSGETMPIFGVAKTLNDADLEELVRLPALINFGNLLSKVDELVRPLTLILGDFAIQGVSVHPDAYGFRFGTSIAKSKGAVYFNPIVIIHGSEGSFSRSINTKNHYYNPNKSELEHFKDVFKGVLVHEISHQLSDSEGQEHARAMTFTEGIISRLYPKLEPILNLFTQEDYDQLKSNSSDLFKRLKAGRNQDVEDAIRKEINKSFVNEQTIQILGDYGRRLSAEGQGSRDPKTDRKSPTGTDNRTDAANQQRGISSSLEENPVIQGLGARENQSNTPSARPNAPPSAEKAARAEVNPSNAADPKLNIKSGEAVDPVIAKIQASIDARKQQKQSAARTADPKDVQEAGEALSAANKRILKDYDKLPKNAIRSSVDLETKRFIDRHLRRNMKALEKFEEQAAEVAYLFIENFTKSRKALDPRAGDNFTKVQNIKDPLVQQAFLDLGVKSDESVAGFLERAADRAFIANKVEKWADQIDGLAEAYESGAFEDTPELSGVDRLNEILQGDKTIEAFKDQIAVKSKERKDEATKLKIKLGESLQAQLATMPISETYAGDGFFDVDVQESATAVREWLLQVDLSKLDSKTLHLNVLALDSMVNDGTFIHSLDAFNASVEMTDAEMKEFGDLKFWDSSPFAANAKGVSERVAATPQKLAMLTHDKKSLEFLNNIYQPLARAGERNQAMGNQIARDMNEIFQDEFGRDMTVDNSIRMGLASYLMQYDPSIDTDKYFSETLFNMQESIRRGIESGGPTSARYHTRAAEILTEMLAGFDPDESNVFDEFQKFLDTYLSQAEKNTLFKTRTYFAKFTNDLRFITEAIRNKPFQDIVNYYRTAQISVNASIPNSTPEELTNSALGQDLLAVDSQDSSITAAPSNTKLRTQKLSNNRNMYLIDFVGLTAQAGRMTAFELTTSIARRKVKLKLNNESVRNIIAQSTNGTRNPERIGALEKWFIEESMNMLLNASFVNDAHKLLKAWMSKVGRLKLSGLHRMISEPLSNALDFTMRNAHSPRNLAIFGQANLEFASPRFKELYQRMGIKERASLAENQLDRPIDPRSSFSKPRFAKTGAVVEAASKIIASPLHIGDQWSARVRGLAEYVIAEINGHRAFSFGDVDFEHLNEESIVTARHEMDKALNTTIASSKGMLYQSHNVGIALLRDTLLAYTSHGATMGVQTAISIRNANYFARTGDAKGVAKEAQVIAAVAVQSAGFVLGKAAILLLLYSMIRGQYRDADDEDKMIALRAEYEAAKAKSNKTESDKERVDELKNELRSLQTARDQLSQWRRQASTEGSIKKFVTDAAGNLILPLGLIPPARDKVMAILVDTNSEKAYSAANKVLQAELTKAARDAQANGDFKKEGRIRQQIEDLQGAQYIQMHRDQFGPAPIFQGAMGIGFEDLESFATQAAGALGGNKEFSIGDLNLLLNGLGVGQTDATKWLNFVDKLENKEFVHQRELETRAELKKIANPEEAPIIKESALEKQARLQLQLNK